MFFSNFLAIITICLDDWEYDPEEQDKVVMELCCSSNPENRWFDKVSDSFAFLIARSIQLICCSWDPFKKFA